MDQTSTEIVDAVLSSSPNHRGGSNVQVSEFSGGGVRLTGLKQLSGTALCQVAKDLDKLISVTATRAGSLAIDVEDIPGENLPKPILAVGTASISTAGSSTTTTVHPLPDKTNTIALSKFIADRSAVDVFLRPTSLTVISVLPSKIRGGLAECIRNGRHAKRLNGSCGSHKLPRKRPKTKATFP